MGHEWRLKVCNRTPEGLVRNLGSYAEVSRGLLL
jgi:hypothetical protein